MPTYFSMTFELNKGPNAIGEFCNVLRQSGPKFKSGFWGFENDSFDDIVKWNQSKLDDDFILGFTEHYSHGYKQMLFEYSDFTEVRLFVMNRREGRTFSVHLIVPEDDLVEYAEENGRYTEKRMQGRMDHLEQLAKTVWADSSVLTIQTSWECSSAPAQYEEISEDRLPQTEPFSIVPDTKYHSQWNLKACIIGRNGRFLKNDDNWFWC